MVGGWSEGYTGYPPALSQDPNISIFKAEGPTHGQMKGKSDYFMRFLRLGLDMVLEWSQNDLRMTSQTPPSDWSRDALRLVSR